MNLNILDRAFILVKFAQTYDYHGFAFYEDDVLAWPFTASIIFQIAEVIGGFLAGSLSVMCDAAHMLSDCGGFALALLAFHCAKRQPDVHMSYGYKRAGKLFVK